MASGDFGSELGERLAAAGRSIGEREAAHAEALAAARRKAESLRCGIEQALDHFHEGLAETGADHLRIELGELRLDDKHVRAIEFDLLRGRHRAIVTVKSRGDVTLVGPFRVGKTEGPCRTFPIDADREIEAALVDFLLGFLEEAAAP